MGEETTKKNNKIIIKLKALVKFKWLMNFLGTRQTKYGSNTLLAVIILLGILILVNYIAQKETVIWDLTKSKNYTLSDQTVKALKNVEEEINVKVFVQDEDGLKTQIEDLLKVYQNKNENIKIEFINPDIKPAIAREYDITRYGTLVFELGDKKEQSLSASEADITSSILKLTRDISKKIYFVSGHNEKDIELVGDAGYSVIMTLLEREGYEVAKLNIVTKKKVPSDAAVVVIAGPRKKFLKAEIDELQKYIKSGGKILALLDPIKETKVDVGLSGTFEKWGINIDDGVVIDPKKYFWTDVGTPVVDQWETHQITSAVSPAFFPGVQLVGEASEHPEDIEIMSLVKTSDESWLEKNLLDEKTKYDKTVDVLGPVSIAMVAQGVDPALEPEIPGIEPSEEDAKEEKEEKPKPRIIVVGDSDFGNNSFAESLGNFDFLINSIDWLAEEEELISIRPKEEESRVVTLTGSQTKTIFYITVVVMPLLVIIMGVGVHMDRKRKRQLIEK